MYGAMKEHLQKELASLREQGLFKDERVIMTPQGADIKVKDGKEVINFCANNYLGLSGHPELVAAARRALDEWGYGLSSVRFICGTQALHLELEKKVAEFLGLEDAILYATCFDANGGVFEPLIGKDDAIVTDQLNHASIIDGVRLCKAKRFVYAHADMVDLEAKLEELIRATCRSWKKSKRSPTTFTAPTVSNSPARRKEPFKKSRTSATATFPSAWPRPRCR